MPHDHGSGAVVAFEHEGQTHGERVGQRQGARGEARDGQDAILRSEGGDGVLLVAFDVREVLYIKKDGVFKHISKLVKGVGDLASESVKVSHTTFTTSYHHSIHTSFHINTL